MPLRILRHKKWHVWNQDNEDRFARDESAFMAKVEEEERSSRMADMEKRIQQMKEMKGINTDVVHPFDQPQMQGENKATFGVESTASYLPDEDRGKEELDEKIKEIAKLKVPTWKLKPTQMPTKRWYEEDLSIKRGRDGQILDEDELAKREKRDEQLKQLEDPLSIITKLRDKEESDNLVQPLSCLRDQYANDKEQHELLKARLVEQPQDILIPVSFDSTTPRTGATEKSNSVISSSHHSHSRSRSHSHSKHHHHNHHHHHHHHHHRSDHMHENKIVTSVEQSDMYQQKQQKALELQKLREERIRRETAERKRTTEVLLQYLH